MFMVTTKMSLTQKGPPFGANAKSCKQGIVNLLEIGKVFVKTISLIEPSTREQITS